MSLNGVIASFATVGDNPDGTYTVTRRADSAYDDNGRLAAPASPTTFTVVARVDPVDPGRQIIIPRPTEHDVTAEKKAVYTVEKLMPRTPTAEGDRITIGGESYEVVASAELEAWGEKHYESIAKREANT